MRNIKRILIVALLAVFVALPVLSQTTTVSAAQAPGGPGGIGVSPFQDQSTTTKAAIWALGRGISKCINDGSNTGAVVRGTSTGSPTIADSDASQGQLEKNFDTNHWVGEFTRLVVNGPGSGGTDGERAACADVVTKELQLTGLSYVDMLCDMGYTRNGDCQQGAGDWNLPTKPTASSSECSGNTNPQSGGCPLHLIWNSFFQSTAVLGASYSAALSDAMRYYIYFNEFQQECGDGNGGGLTVSDWSNQQTDSHSYHVPWYTDGAVQDSYVVSGQYDSSHLVRLDGWKMLDGGSGNTGNDMLSCGALANRLVQYGPAFKAAIKADQRNGKDQLDTGSTGDNGDSDPTCESSSGELGWILCGIIDGLQNAVGGIYDHVIKPLLVTPPLTSKDARGSGIFTAWSNFRIYGDVFLVIALLIIVFGESLGGGVIDAYTAKKVLPRLLAAAILINLSYYIAAVLVDITNILGDGMMTLITAPFGLTTGQFAIQIDKSGATTMSALLGGAVVWGALSASGAFLSWLWAAVLVPMLLIFLAIMVVVLLRSALIVFLVIIAPVAFALYCLPNTEKYFRQWWDALFKTLLVYPIIAVLFALGKVAGYLINLTSNANFVTSGIGTVMAVVAMVIPLLLVPFAFRLAGGVIGRAHDLVAGGRQRLHAMGEGRRAEAKARLSRVQQQRKAFATDKLVNKNPIGRGISAIPIAGKHFAAMGSRAEQRVSMMQGELMRDPRLAPVANDEYALRAGMYGSHQAAVNGLTQKFMQDNPDWSEAEARQNARAAANRWQGTGIGFSQSAGIAAFQAAVADGVVFKDNKDQLEAINQITGDNESLRYRVWGAAYAGNKQAGRYDLSPSYGTGAKILDRMAAGETVSELDFKKAAVEGGRSTSNTDLSRMKGKGMDNLTEAMGYVIENGDDLDRAQTVTKARNMQDSDLYMPEALVEKLHTQAINQPAMDRGARQVQDVQFENLDQIERMQVIQQAEAADRVVADAQRAVQAQPNNQQVRDDLKQAQDAAEQANNAAAGARAAQAAQDQRLSGRADPFRAGLMDQGGKPPDPPGTPEQH